MLYKIECFENIFNRIYSIKKNSQTVIYLSAVVLISSKQHGWHEHRLCNRHVRELFKVSSRTKRGDKWWSCTYKI